MRIRDVQKHRGPDSAGVWFSKNNRLALGHRRLSIIDLSSSADQPMTCGDSEHVIVFNGEIYNYGALRDALIAKGVNFDTNSDTEVLLKGYRHWGTGILQRLRGMYAFAIWDELRSSMFLARDPYGIKPLYYSVDGRVLRFASQVKALVQGNLHTFQEDSAGIVGFLMMGSVPEPYTTYRAIRALGAGQYLIVDRTGVTKPRTHFSVGNTWRSAAVEPKVATAEEMESVIGNAIRDTVEHHMVADVPVGAFLSSGIDSGALVGVMSKVSRQPIQTITVGFSTFRGTHNDETILAAELARLYGADHKTHWVTDAEIEQDLPQLLEAMDQPSIDGFNTWLVSKVANQRGLKVVVSGVGGDELLGGYEHFAQLPKWSKSHREMQRVPGFARIGFWLSRSFAAAGLVPIKAPAWIRYGNSYPGLYLARRGLFMPWEISKIIDPDLAKAGLEELKPPGFINMALGKPLGNSFATIAALESILYLRNQLLRDSDWASMAHSLELRTPLVDTHLLNKLAPYLAHENNQITGKLGLAKVPKPGLPSNVVDREKSGFSLPMARWVEQSEALDGWRSFSAVNGYKSSWARRLACALIAERLQ